MTLNPIVCKRLAALYQSAELAKRLADSERHAFDVAFAVAIESVGLDTAKGYNINFETGELVEQTAPSEQEQPVREEVSP